MLSISRMAECPIAIAGYARRNGSLRIRRIGRCSAAGVIRQRPIHQCKAKTAASPIPTSSGTAVSYLRLKKVIDRFRSIQQRWQHKAIGISRVHLQEPGSRRTQRSIPRPVKWVSLLFGQRALFGLVGLRSDRQIWQAQPIRSVRCPVRQYGPRFYGDAELCAVSRSAPHRKHAAGSVRETSLCLGG